MKSTSTDDPEFYRFDKSLPTQAADITPGQIYTNQACSVAYVSGGAIGDVLYVKATEADTGASEFRPGHQVLIALSTDPLMNCNGKVTYVSKTGTTVTLGVKLIEADNNSTTHDISDADRIRIIGSINPEGSEMPDSISYDPSKRTNTTQIFRNSLSLTRTRMRTKVRYGTTPYQEAKRDCLELHGIEMEKSFIWGIYTIGTGDNGQPERTTAGLKSFIPSTNISDFRSDTDFSGQTWLSAGRKFINKWLELVFRYGSRNRTAYVGSGTVLAINQLVEAYGLYTFTPKTLSYGIQIMEWVTPFGTIDMYTHPLFSFEQSERYSMLLFDPSNLEYRYIDDTFFQKDENLKNGSIVSLDGIKEGYLTECGLEVHHPITMAYLTGFGYDA
jgi:hypothetical protein